MNSLSAEQLTVGYGDRLIAKELDIAIPKGKITTLIGPNGCGKSTVLKTMSRIMKPKSGAVYLNGQAIMQNPRRTSPRKWQFFRRRLKRRAG